MISFAMQIALSLSCQTGWRKVRATQSILLPNGKVPMLNREQKVLQKINYLRKLSGEKVKT